MSGKGKQTPRKIIAKQKDSPKPGPASLDSPETPKDCALSFPLLKTVDNARTLPRYSVVLGRPDEEGVVMEDLDGLQLELEALLSAVVVRTRVLREEIRILSDEEEKRDRSKLTAVKKSNPVGRPSLKRSKSEEKVTKKFREGHKSNLDCKPAAVASPIKFTKVKTVSLVSNPLNQHMLESDSFQNRVEGRKVVSPKNDTPNKFWQSVEPYVADVTHDDIKLLQDLIAEQENMEYYTAIPLGKHYTLRWASDDVPEEAAGSHVKIKKEPGVVVKKEKIIDTTGPLTQRLVSALLEENCSVVDKKPGNDKSGCGPENNGPTVLRSFSMNFERRLRKELEEQGIVDPPEAKDEDDEILADIERCQTEMFTVATYNLQQLKRVLEAAQVEIERHELNRKLEVVDAEICELYKKIQANKQKKKPANKREQDLAWKALQDRKLLIQQIDSM